MTLPLPDFARRHVVVRALKNIRCWLLGGHRLWSTTYAPDDVELTWCERCHPHLHRTVLNQHAA